GAQLDIWGSSVNRGQREWGQWHLPATSWLCVCVSSPWPVQKLHRNRIHSPTITTPCGSAASLSLGSSSSWASLSSLARDVDANSTNSRELGNPTKRRELSAAPSAVCHPAGGRTSTWLQETQPEPP
ncbi:FXYD domain-containing ion transport regulator 1, isoform CRA_e, partial [Mus musculus]